MNTSQKYLYYVALCLHDELNSIGTGSTYTAVSVDEIRNVVIPQPPSFEQQSITDCLDQRISTVENSIEKQQQQIEFLREYRTTLISEVVTGKMDVRE